MTQTAAPPAAREAAPSPLRRMWLWGTAHAVDDLYQGLVPAVVPYFVLDRGYGYVAATGLTLAAALGASIPQPFFGVLVDRRRLDWFAPAGVALAGIGLGLAGLAGPYPLVLALIFASGLGVAMFHPAAGKGAREAAGDSAAGMSIFAAGGSVGFFLAPVLATPALMAMGVGATALFIPPAVLIAFVMLRKHTRTAAGPAKARTGTDRWGPFAVLTGIEVVRSILWVGIITFIELYWIRHLGASHAVAGIALAGFMFGSVAGTLMGGRLADRFGAVRTTRIGGVMIVPLLVLLRFVPDEYAAVAVAIAVGIAINIPFAVLVKLAQDYLPTRPGTAAGVTLGLAMSVGGLFAPAFGLIAERHGPEGVFTALCAVPLVAVALGLFLKKP
ncbi:MULTISPECIES: MFS transporter [Glycomyces]|uniref:MFS transporter n=2 Tax=Glycomyces TaxID=58113 RepID=A0A9X3T8H0_9ACTN|nr:MFS transporter [Glycomyces lechevalierae]MDA1385168.1 MFS transporter [Glycomyces lechevalierae]MDR7337216.1 FSR family fosmidomycin resistance protein-like MFS transporter [Glycomyces lechevalierae]